MPLQGCLAPASTAESVKIVSQGLFRLEGKQWGGWRPKCSSGYSSGFLRETQGSEPFCRVDTLHGTEAKQPPRIGFASVPLEPVMINEVWLFEG